MHTLSVFSAFQLNKFLYDTYVFTPLSLEESIEIFNQKMFNKLTLKCIVLYQDNCPTYLWNQYIFSNEVMDIISDCTFTKITYLSIVNFQYYVFSGCNLAKITYPSIVDFLILHSHFLKTMNKQIYNRKIRWTKERIFRW